MAALLDGERWKRSFTYQETVNALQSGAYEVPVEVEESGDPPGEAAGGAEGAAGGGGARGGSGRRAARLVVSEVRRALGVVLCGPAARAAPPETRTHFKYVRGEERTLLGVVGADYARVAASLSAGACVLEDGRVGEGAVSLAESAERSRARVEALSGAELLSLLGAVATHDGALQEEAAASGGTSGVGVAPATFGLAATEAGVRLGRGDGVELRGAGGGVGATFEGGPAGLCMAAQAAVCLLPSQEDVPGAIAMARADPSPLVWDRRVARPRVVVVGDMSAAQAYGGARTGAVGVGEDLLRRTDLSLRLQVSAPPDGEAASSAGAASSPSSSSSSSPGVLDAVGMTVGFAGLGRSIDDQLVALSSATSPASPPASSSSTSSSSSFFPAAVGATLCHTRGVLVMRAPEWAGHVWLRNPLAIRVATVARPEGDAERSEVASRVSGTATLRGLAQDRLVRAVYGQFRAALAMQADVVVVAPCFLPKAPAAALAVVYRFVLAQYFPGVFRAVVFALPPSARLQQRAAVSAAAAPTALPPTALAVRAERDGGTRGPLDVPRGASLPADAVWDAAAPLIAPALAHAASLGPRPVDVFGPAALDADPFLGFYHALVRRGEDLHPAKARAAAGVALLPPAPQPKKDSPVLTFFRNLLEAGYDSD